MYEIAVWVKRWLWTVAGFGAVWAGATVVAKVLDSQDGSKVL